MTYIRWPKCGHRRTGTNTSAKGTCRTCLAKVGKANLSAWKAPAPLSAAALSIDLEPDTQPAKPMTFQPLNHALAAEVRALLERGLSHRDVCAEMNYRVSIATVSRIRNGMNPPRIVPKIEQSPAPPTGDGAIALYRTEKARRQERMAESPAVIAAKKEFAAMLEREKLAGRGGRPKGSKNGGNSLAPKMGRPNIFAQRCEPGDELIVALGHFGGL